MWVGTYDDMYDDVYVHVCCGLYVLTLVQIEIKGNKDNKEPGVGTYSF